MAAPGPRKRFRTSTACTNCRQLKMKCDRRERLKEGLRCARCEGIDGVCELSGSFTRRRMKDGDGEETRRLRLELEELKGRVEGLGDDVTGSVCSVEPLRQVPTHRNGNTRSSSTHVISPPTMLEACSPVIEQDTTCRRADGITLLPGQIDGAFEAFWKDMHPYLPFLDAVEPDACYERDPFLFWTICMLGLRSSHPELSTGLSSHVTKESIQAPLRSCHDQNAATAVVQGLLLLSIWPVSNPSLLHEASWLHCGSATHLALHLGLHQPFSAAEFVPEDGRNHIHRHFVEFRRTWIAVYITNCIISYIRGYPTTVRADYNIIEYTLSSPEALSLHPDLFKTLLIARRIEEGQDLGHSRTSQHGQIDPGSREGIFRLLQSRISDTERRASPLTPFISMIVMATKLQPAIQVLQSTSPISLQETTALSACDDACKVISIARQVQSQANMVHLPVFVDSLVLMSTVLIFKIHISRFASLINGQMAQSKISEACSYFRDGINDFNDIPARVLIFVEALYTLVAEDLVPVGGYVIENTKSRYSQNILYEVLWTFKEWKRRKMVAIQVQQEPVHDAGISELVGSDPMFAFLNEEQLDHTFWASLDVF